jgi:hypothetical protein
MSVSVSPSVLREGALLLSDAAREVIVWRPPASFGAIVNFDGTFLDWALAMHATKGWVGSTVAVSCLGVAGPSSL